MFLKFHIQVNHTIPAHKGQTSSRCLVHRSPLGILSAEPVYKGCFHWGFDTSMLYTTYKHFFFFLKGDTHQANIRLHFPGLEVIAVNNYGRQTVSHGIFSWEKLQRCFNPNIKGRLLKTFHQLIILALEDLIET